MLLLMNVYEFFQAKNKAGRPRGRAIRVDVDLSISGFYTISLFFVTKQKFFFSIAN